MITLYRVHKYPKKNQVVEKHEVIRVTEQSYFYKPEGYVNPPERRCGLVTEYEHNFLTEKEAWEYAVGEYMRKTKRAEGELANMRDLLARSLEGLKNHGG